MKLKNKIKIVNSILKSYFNQKTPLSVSWTLLNRCNKKCQYCNLPNIKTKELTTKQIFSIIDELAEMECQRIGFTGGEPFLRNDIREIIDYVKQKGIFVGIVSNGALINSNNIDALDLLQLSLDGEKEINDIQRYHGSFNDVVRAIKLAKKKYIKVWVTYTLTKNNLDTSFILDFAKEHNLKIFFQPVVDYKNCGLTSKNLFPLTNRFRNSIKQLIYLKNKPNSYIGNSLDGLKYLNNWPNFPKLNCLAGMLFAHIYPNGDVFPCFNMDNQSCINCEKEGFKNAFDLIQRSKCDGCWTYANIDMNLLLNFNLNTIFNTVRLMK